MEKDFNTNIESSTRTCILMILWIYYSSDFFFPDMSGNFVRFFFLNSFFLHDFFVRNRLPHSCWTFLVNVHLNLWVRFSTFCKALSVSNNNSIGNYSVCDRKKEKKAKIFLDNYCSLHIDIHGVYYTRTTKQITSVVHVQMFPSIVSIIALFRVFDVYLRLCWCFGPDLK